MYAMATGARSATKWRDQTIIGLLEKLSRERELHPEECALMERTVRRLKPKRSIWRWSEKEDRLLSEFIKRRAYLPRPKPFQPNDEVRLLAQSLNRSYETTHKRLQLLRKAMNFPNAGKRRKG